MVSLVSIIVWKWNIVFSIAFFLFFGFIDGAYLSATLLKVPEGAWTTIVIAAVLTMFMLIWHSAKLKQWAYEEGRAQNLTDQIHTEVVHHDGNQSLVKSLKRTGERLENLKGLAIVFDSDGFGIPAVFSHFMDAFAATPDMTVFLHIRNLAQPMVSPMVYDAALCIDD